ncbi:ABC-type transport auxiliary lipoprotein family protein [Chondromyces apiculatus]|nr:ABC-type transport auxiliary lipoprotein family protein [Chondromyces apiculatus]
MQIPRALGALFAAALSLNASACALLTKSDPTTFRYYTPERLAPPETPAELAAPKPDADPAYKLRLRAVRAAEHLKERIVFRDSPAELGFHDELRWAELPEDSLRRILSAALFENRKIQQVIAGAAATLEVEMIALEEVRKPRHAGRVQIMFLVHDGNLVRFRETVTVEHPIPEDKEDEPEAIVGAISDALATAVDRIVTRTLTELGSITPTRPSTTPEPPPLP